MKARHGSTYHTSSELTPVLIVVATQRITRSGKSRLQNSSYNLMICIRWHHENVKNGSAFCANASPVIRCWPMCAQSGIQESRDVDDITPAARFANEAGARPGNVGLLFGFD